MTRQSTDICAQCARYKVKEYPEQAAQGKGRCTGYDGGFAELKDPFLLWSTRACVLFNMDWTNKDARARWADRQKEREQNNNAVQTQTKG